MMRNSVASGAEPRSDPSRFEDFSLQQINVLIDGSEVKNSSPLVVDFNTNKFTTAYHQTMMIQNPAHEPAIMSMKDYKNK